ncbi:substrate-binding domain-containing protein [Labrys monachus]|uniref:DeoR/GlpR family transcriptional regulator of sugar metabolism/DNA-binding LacI/PurR family transcriptional regulator n=1 Tax=Labrys monachus TaxID=217067 RepID=A0ABU0FBC5_9HYPH|nr:substrate-binding domain-containing protein [Labrys monachus]MDQ0391424.1 DeoR/GlpR family transcriptional regulator of sugar metabolism/DNA-binding LacI/PurR family transcriptional regulator [Labrys monachus]
MIAIEREEAILGLLKEKGTASLRVLQQKCPDASAVTLRRDLARLESQGRLRRIHGGAVRIAAADMPEPADRSGPEDGQHAFDGLILPPVGGRWAHTLRQQAMRRGMPFLAESAPQAGGIYLGPANRQESHRLGLYAGQRHGHRAKTAEVLLVTLEALPNARERVEGFMAGFAEAFPGDVVFHRVHGQGLFKEAMRRATDAFRAHPDIDVIFGANDHTTLGAIEAAKRLGKPVVGYSVGGEGGTLFDELARGGVLQAVLVLFPEVVGLLAIDTICRQFAGEEVGEAVITPAEVITPQTLGDFYQRDDNQWRLRPEVLARMVAGRTYAGPPIAGRSIGFMLHYPSHEWYRSLAAAMRRRSAEVGAVFVARNAEDEVAEQIHAIKRMIGATAATEVRPKETLLIDGGECSRYFAEALRASGQQATVYTNALAILEILADAPGIKLFLTAGEYQPATRSLVGPSVGALLETIRVDKAIVSPDGVATGFGLSFEDERAALVCRRFCDSAREVVILADHSVVGLESRVQAARLSRPHTIFTDAGTLPAHRLDLSTAGLRVIIADEDGDEEAPLWPVPQVKKAHR